MTKALRTYGRHFAAIIVLAVIGIAVGGYVLANQRMRFPIIDEKPFTLKAEFSTAQAVTPGQGQTVRVSGVRIGDIGRVELRGGRAVVTMDIDQEFRGLVRTDARALLRPKTGLKDMFIELVPGSDDAPAAREGWTMPVANTMPDVNPDEILAALDGDTRDYLQLLVSGGGQGLKGKGGQLRELFRRFEPTHRDLARVTSKVAERRANLRRLITNLNRLNGELATKDDELAQLVDSSAGVFRAFASESANVTQAVEELPSALRRTRETLGKVETFAGALGSATERLRPAVRKLDDANAAVRPLAREAAPLLRDPIRPFVRETRPLVRELRPAAANLARSTPDLDRSFVVLNHLFNLIGFNPNGREGPEKAGRDEGYLFWIAWLGHNTGALFSTSDANGIFRPVAFTAPCTSLRQLIQEEPELEFLQSLSGALTDPRVCGGQP
jgi:phospholipid/cholesterol/gamma-HCH transport system substrate-binding protein